LLDINFLNLALGFIAELIEFRHWHKLSLRKQTILFGRTRESQRPFSAAWASDAGTE